jgi:streptogramin lyase
MWFTDPAAGTIGRLDPATGAITQYSADQLPGTRPDAIVAGPDGAMWFTSPPAPNAGDTQAAIGRTDPATGAITEYPEGLRAVSSPGAITAAGGALWFADAG